MHIQNIIQAIALIQDNTLSAKPEVLRCKKALCGSLRCALRFAPQH
jgi:hypothetical protein